MASRNKYLRQWMPLDSRADTIPADEVFSKDPENFLSELPFEHYQAAMQLLFCRESADIVSYDMPVLNESLEWQQSNEVVRFAAHFKPSLSDRRRKFVFCLALPLLFAIVLTVFQTVVQLLGGYYDYYWSEQSWAGTITQILLWLSAVFVLLIVWADFPLDCTGSCVLTNLRVIRIYDVGDYLLSPSTESYWYSGMWLRSLTLNFLTRDWFYLREDVTQDIRPLSLKFSLLGNLKGFAKITPAPRVLQELCRTFLSEVARIEVPSYHIVTEINVDEIEVASLAAAANNNNSSGTQHAQAFPSNGIDHYDEDDDDTEVDPDGNSRSNRQAEEPDYEKGLTANDVMHGLFTGAEWTEVLLLLSRCRTNRWLTDCMFGCLFLPWVFLFLITFLDRDVLQFIVGNAISLFFMYISSCLITLRFIGSAHRARRSEALDQVVQALNHKFRNRGLNFVNSLGYPSNLAVRIYQVVEPLTTNLPPQESYVEYFEIPFDTTSEDETTSTYSSSSSGSSDSDSSTD